MTQVLFLFEEQAEDLSDQRTRIGHLPEAGHREVKRSRLEPDRDKLIAGVLKEERRDKAHDRAHQTDDHP